MERKQYQHGDQWTSRTEKSPRQYDNDSKDKVINTIAVMEAVMPRNTQLSTGIVRPSS